MRRLRAGGEAALQDRQRPAVLRLLRPVHQGGVLPLPGPPASQHPRSPGPADLHHLRASGAGLRRGRRHAGPDHLGRPGGGAGVGGGGDPRRRCRCRPQPPLGQVTRRRPGRRTERPVRRLERSGGHRPAGGGPGRRRCHPGRAPGVFRLRDDEVADPAGERTAGLHLVRDQGPPRAVQPLRQGGSGVHPRRRGRSDLLPVPGRRPGHLRGLHRLQPAPPGGPANARGTPVPGLLAAPGRGRVLRVRRGPGLHQRHRQGPPQVHHVRQAPGDVQRVRKGRLPGGHGLRHRPGVLDLPQEGPRRQGRLQWLRPAPADRPPRPRAGRPVLGLRRVGALERVHGVSAGGPALRGRALRGLHVGAPPARAARLLGAARAAPGLPRRLRAAPGRRAVAGQAGVRAGPDGDCPR